MAEPEVKQCVSHAVELIRKSNEFAAIENTSIVEHSTAASVYLPTLLEGTLKTLIEGSGKLTLMTLQ